MDFFWRKSADQGPYNHLQEQGARMGDLEAEHDYLLERQGLVGVSSRLEGEGEAEALVGVAERPALCSLRPDPGPCGSQVQCLFC